MPNKEYDNRRHHIPKMSFKAQKWSNYQTDNVRTILPINAINK